MRTTFLPYNVPDVGEEEAEAVARVVRSRWITRGPQTAQFEQELQAYFEGRPVVAVSSCTAALHLALLSLGIGPGDEVITTPYTFCASINAIIYVGAQPVLADVEPDTANLDPRAVRAAITPHTRAILPVHFAGHPVDLEALQDVAEAHHLAVIEDAAHGIGARYRGRRIGTSGNPVAFSFYATKNLTTGEGGALVLPEPRMAEQVRVLSLHGMSRHAWNRYTVQGSWDYEIQGVGFKYNMTDIQAAMGRVQLEKLDRMQARRAELAARLSHGLRALPVTVPVVRADVDPAWHLYPLRVHRSALNGDRGDVIRDLRAENIGTSVHFIPIHYHRYYQERFGWRPGMFPVAEEYFAQEISLPLYPGMSDGDVDDVIAALSRVLERRRRR